MRERSGLKELYNLFAQIDDAPLIELIFEDVLTHAELADLSQRIQILKRLLKGESQRDIARNLGVSLATVSRGSRVLKYGHGAVAGYIQTHKL